MDEESLNQLPSDVQRYITTFLPCGTRIMLDKESAKCSRTDNKEKKERAKEVMKIWLKELVTLWLEANMIGDGGKKLAAINDGKKLPFYSCVFTNTDTDNNKQTYSVSLKARKEDPPDPTEPTHPLTPDVLVIELSNRNDDTPEESVDGFVIDKRFLFNMYVRIKDVKQNVDNLIDRIAEFSIRPWAHKDYHKITFSTFHGDSSTYLEPTRDALFKNNKLNPSVIDSKHFALSSFYVPLDTKTSTSAGMGGGKKVRVLGRDRKVYIIRGRPHIKYHGAFITLAKARKMR